MTTYQRKAFFKGIAAILLVVVTTGGCGDDKAGKESGGNFFESPGPYAIGNRTMLFEDDSRIDPATGRNRQLLTEVWYPAADAEGDHDVVKDFFGDYRDFALNIFTLVYKILDYPAVELENFHKETGSVRDAAIDAADGPYPLVVFSHGNIGIRFQSLFLTEHLASHGFIVASTDHTANAFATMLPEGIVFYNPLLMINSFLDRPQDMAALIDVFEGLNAYDPEGFFEGLVATDVVALAGHSFGGVAALTLIGLDERAAVAATYAAPWLPIYPAGFDKPILFMIGSEDLTMGIQNLQIKLDYYLTPSTRFLMNILDGGHYTFTDGCQLAPSLFGNGDGCGEGHRQADGSPFTFIDSDLGHRMINGNTLALFRYAISGNEEALDYLTTNRFPENMEHEFEIVEKR